jgi:ammonium transporter Rh
MKAHDPQGVTVGLMDPSGVVVGSRDQRVIVVRRSTMSLKRFGLLLLALQIAFAIMFAIFGQYGPAASPPPTPTPTPNLTAIALLGGSTPAPHAEPVINDLKDFYPMFQDVHVMIFIGFGFLMTFLKKYGYSSVGVNFVLAAFCLEWYFFLHGFFHLSANYTMLIDIVDLIKCDFASAAVLISMGALLGKLSPEQYIVLGFFELAFYAVNEYIIFDLLQVNDSGDSITVHTFGAYFGLAAARVMYKKGTVGNSNEGPVYHSDLFAMIGTVFLWIYWPSFNGGVAAIGDQQHRCIINTYLSLAACCLVAFAVSSLLNHEGKFDMVHVQNATLAGGVAIGTSANLVIHPMGAVIVGGLTGAISVFGYKYITPFLANKLQIHDTCGVNNLHGMPGIIAGVVGAIVSGFATFDIYSTELYSIFPARDPNPLVNANPRGPWDQAGIQFGAVFIALAISIVGGAITGAILRLPIWTQVHINDMHDDAEFWEVPDGQPDGHEIHNGVELQKL